LALVIRLVRTLAAHQHRISSPPLMYPPPHHSTAHYSLRPIIPRCSPRGDRPRTHRLLSDEHGSAAVAHTSLSGYRRGIAHVDVVRFWAGNDVRQLSLAERERACDAPCAHRLGTLLSGPEGRARRRR